MIVLKNGLVISKFSFPQVEHFALELRDRLGLRSFIETGTYLGTTACWAAQHFEAVATIEVNEEFYERAKAIAPKNMHCFLGDSKDILPSVIDSVRGPALFYLDAHNFNHLFGAGPDICPLMDELKAAFAHDPTSAIWIDDAGSFANQISDVCPPLEQLTELARQHGRLHGIAFDILAIVPEQTGDLLAEFTIDRGSGLIAYPIFADDDFQPGETTMSDKPNDDPQPAENQSEMPAGFGWLTFNEDLIEIIPAKKPEENKDPEPPAE